MQTACYKDQIVSYCIILGKVVNYGERIFLGFITYFINLAWGGVKCEQSMIDVGGDRSYWVDFRTCTLCLFVLDLICDLVEVTLPIFICAVHCSCLNTTRLGY